MRRRKSTVDVALLGMRRTKSTVDVALLGMRRTKLTVDVGVVLWLLVPIHFLLTRAVDKTQLDGVVESLAGDARA